MGFNRARGINADNDEGDNLVTVIETGSNGDGYSQSFLLAKKSQGQTHTIENFGETGEDIEIVVDKIDQTSPIWKATVSIGRVGSTNQVCFSPQLCLIFLPPRN